MSAHEKFIEAQMLMDRVNKMIRSGQFSSAVEVIKKHCNQFQIRLYSDEKPDSIQDIKNSSRNFT